MSAWRPARWTATMGSASSGSSIGAESSARTASGASPRRMPSVVDWRMSSDEIWSRSRVPDVTAMAPATRPVLTRKKTAAAARMAGTSAALNASWCGRTPAATSTAPAAAMASTYCAMLKALRDGRLRSMRSLRPDAAATAIAAAARPEDSSRAKVKVVDGATSPSPVPSLIGTSSPTMTAANRTHMPAGPSWMSADPWRTATETRSPSPDAMTAVT